MMKRKTPELLNRGVFLGRKRLEPEERREQFNIAIKKKLADEMRKIPGYNNIVEQLIEEYLKKNKD